jgi:hypothetical protein
MSENAFHRKLHPAGVYSTFAVGFAVSLQTVSLSAPYNPRPFLAKKINPTKNPPLQAGGMATSYFPRGLPPKYRRG